MQFTMEFLTVLGLGAIELWAAIPTGMAMQLHPVLTGLATTIGAISGALIVVLVGEQIRTRLMRGHGRKGEKGPHGSIYQIWRRYGVIGLGLLAPLLTGAPLGTALGIALGAPVGPLLVWIALGIVLWSTLLTLAGTLGLEAVKVLLH